MGVRDRIRRRRAGAAAWKVVVGVVGTAVLLAGVAMLALPGPGWATIVAGVAIWSTEFRWAERLRHWLVRVIVEAGRWVRRQPWWLRALSWGGVVVAVVLAGYASLAAVGVPSWLPDSLRQALTALPLLGA